MFRILRVRPAISLAAGLCALALSACTPSIPIPPPVMEFAIVADSGPAALELDRRTADGISRVRLEKPERFAIASRGVTQDHEGHPALAFDLTPSDNKRFREWTGANVDRHMAILLDGRVMTVATIMGPLSGQSLISLSNAGLSDKEINELLRRWKNPN